MMVGLFDVYEKDVRPELMPKVEQKEETMFDIEEPTPQAPQAGEAFSLSKLSAEDKEALFNEFKSMMLVEADKKGESSDLRND